MYYMFTAEELRTIADNLDNTNTMLWLPKGDISD